MSEMAPETAPTETVVPSEPVVTDDSSTADSDLKVNPAWQPVLEALPTSLHGAVMPTLKDWDRNVNEKFREIHGQYESVKPFQDILESGVTFEEVQGAITLAQRIAENPQEVYDAMREYYKFESQQANADPEQIDPYADPNTQELEELRTKVSQMEQFIQSQQQQSQEAQEAEQLESALTEAAQKHGEFDREFVLTQMIAGESIEGAIKSYQRLVDDIKTQNNRPPAPTVIGGGSGAVAAPPSTKDMSSGDRRNYIAEVLKRNKEQ